MKRVARKPPPPPSKIQVRYCFPLARRSLARSSFWAGEGANELIQLGSVLIHSRCTLEEVREACFYIMSRGKNVVPGTGATEASTRDA